MRKILTVIITALLLSVGMVVVRHIDNLNNSIEFKKIELKDNTVKLKLLDTKYQDLNNQLDKAGVDKAKLEQQFKELQEERDHLQSQLITKQASKNLTTVARAESSDAKMFIYMHESGNNPAAINSIGCRGLGQACPGSKLPCSNIDYACQDIWFTNYMIQRYGTWDNAKNFWLANNWW